MDDISKRLEVLTEKLEAIRVLQAIHTEQLREHMRRTELLELEVRTVSGDLEPLNKHVAMVNGAFKLIGVLTTIAAAIAAIKGAL